MRQGFGVRHAEGDLGVRMVLVERGREIPVHSMFTVKCLKRHLYFLDVTARDNFVAFENAFALLRGRIATACATQRERPARVAAGVHAAFAFAVEQPKAARTLTCEALARGEEGQYQYGGLISYFATLLLSGRKLYASEVAGPPPLTETALVSGVTLMVGRRLDQGREDELPAAAAATIQFVLTPYMGVETARTVTQASAAQSLTGPWRMTPSVRPAQDGPGAVHEPSPGHYLLHQRTTLAR